MIKEKKIKISFSTYITEEEDYWLREFGKLLLKENVISKNSKYQIAQYLVKKTVNELKNMMKTKEKISENNTD